MACRDTIKLARPMLLEPNEVKLFFRLHKALMFHVNQRLGVVPQPLATPEDFAAQPPDIRLKVRDAFLANVDLIDSFAAENPARLSDDEMDIVRSWRHFIHGKFHIFRELARHTVFLTTTDPAVAYGVVALTQPLEEIVGPYLPVMVETVLLPFKNRIVYDGLMTSYNVSFGPGIKRSLSDCFKEAKDRQGIVTSLPAPAPETLPPGKASRKAAPASASKEKSAQALTNIIELIDRFCREHLNEEYADLCRALARKLARKRPSPLVSGSVSAWASGIVRTIGWVNFLHDKSQSPTMRLGDIDAHFGIGESTGAAKSSAIRKLLGIHQLDPNWCLPSRLDDNPLIWMLTVNGFMMDVRHAPREVQEIAFHKGLIPYIPADREQGA